MESALTVLVAVVGGWLVQLYLTYRQGVEFNRRTVALRKRGTVAVGVAGNRYRGGRAYVALAVDSTGVVRDAITLQGWTTLARGKPLPALFDVRATTVAGSRDFAGLTRQQREASRNAVESLRASNVST